MFFNKILERLDPSNTLVRCWLDIGQRRPYQISQGPKSGQLYVLLGETLFQEKL